MSLIFDKNSPLARLPLHLSSFVRIVKESSMYKLFLLRTQPVYTASVLELCAHGRGIEYYDGCKNTLFGGNGKVLFEKKLGHNGSQIYFIRRIVLKKTTQWQGIIADCAGKNRGKVLFTNDKGGVSRRYFFSL